MKKLIIGAMLLALAVTAVGCNKYGSAPKPSHRATANTSTSLTNRTMKPGSAFFRDAHTATSSVSKPAEGTKSAAKAIKPERRSNGLYEK